MTDEPRRHAMSRAERRERKKLREEERLLASGAKLYMQSVKPPTPPKPATSRPHPPTSRLVSASSVEPSSPGWRPEQGVRGRMKRQTVGEVVDDEHALMIGAVSMLLTMNEERLSGVLCDTVTAELDQDHETRFGNTITLDVGGLGERYRIHVEAVRE